MGRRDKDTVSAPEMASQGQIEDLSRQLDDAQLEATGLRRSLEAMLKDDPVGVHYVRIHTAWSVRFRIIRMVLDSRLNGTDDELLATARKIYDWVKPTEEEMQLGLAQPDEKPGAAEHIKERGYHFQGADPVPADA